MQHPKVKKKDCENLNLTSGQGTVISVALVDPNLSVKVGTNISDKRRSVGIVCSRTQATEFSGTRVDSLVCSCCMIHGLCGRFKIVRNGVEAIRAAAFRTATRVINSFLPSSLPPQAAALSHESYLCVSFPQAVDIDVRDTKKVGTCAEERAA
jgi:hypothetical protein